MRHLEHVRTNCHQIQINYHNVLDSPLAFWAGLRYLFAMINETVDKLAHLLAESVPDSLRSVREDLENNFRSVLKTGLGRMDLVTREEFEVQEAVLARSRAKLKSLEERLESLEQESVAKKTGKKPVKKKVARKKVSERKPSGKKAPGKKTPGTKAAKKK